MHIYREIIELNRLGRPAVIATVVSATGSTPRKAGAKMLVKEDGTTVGTIGGGAIENNVIEEARRLLHTSGTKLIETSLKEMGMICGGGMSVFLESLNPAPKLCIFGAGHIGRVLSELGSVLGFHVTVVDNRKDVATAELLPAADDIVAEDYSEAVRDLSFDANTYIVILTHKHAHDYDVLEACVDKEYRYLGMIGSKRKVGQCLDKLREKGIAEEIIAGIHSPIGIKIGGSTPAEIAVSIAAELVQVRNRKTESPGTCPSDL